MAHPATHERHAYGEKIAHTRNFPCPICGGYETMPQHLGVRCYGFTIGSDVAFCTRESLGGALRPTAQGYYPHQLKRRCNCGNDHGSVVAAVRSETLRNQSVPVVRPAEGEGRIGSLIADSPMYAGLVDPSFDPELPVSERYYAMRDIQGLILAFHQRINLASGEKVMPWHAALPDGPEPVPAHYLYGLELLHDLQPGETVFLTEGEEAARALRRQGLVALATVCGAKGTPVDEVLAYLRPYVVVLWPDNDPDGLAHMARIGSRLRALGTYGVGWLEPPVNAVKGFDAADYYKDENEDPEYVNEIVADFLQTAVPFLEKEPWLEPQPGEDPVDVFDGNERAKARRRQAIELQGIVADALDRLGENGDASDIRTCNKRWNAGYCDPKLGGCGKRIATRRSCGTPVCPRCSLSRMFGLLRDKLPDYEGLKFHFYRLRPHHAIEMRECVKRMAERFTTARKRHDLGGGWYAPVFSRSPYLLIAVDDAGEQPGDAFSGFDVESAGNGSLEDFGYRVADAYADEVREVFDGDMEYEAQRDFLHAVKGRRRLQGFGKIEADPTSGTSMQRNLDQQGNSESADPLAKTYLKPFSGSHRQHKKGELSDCPFCNAHTVHFYSSINLIEDQIIDEGNGKYSWRYLKAS